MATRLIGTDDANPRLPVVVISATQGYTHADLAPGDVLADANAYTDEQIADVTAGGVSFADDTETITGTATLKAVTPAGLRAALPFVDVRSHGATGDGVTNDTAAIQAAIAATATDGTLWFPPGIYKITSTLTIGQIDVVMADSTTSYLSYSGSGTAVIIDSARHTRVRMHVQNPTVTWDNGTDTTSIGVVVRNCWHLRATFTIWGYWRGLVLRGDANGVVHNEFDLEGIGNCKTGVYVDIITTGWVNQNRFYGQIFYASGLVSYANTCMIDMTAGGNANSFIGVSLEGSVHAKTFKIRYGWNLFLNCRFEANPAGSCEFQAGSQFNQVIGGYDHRAASDAKFADAGTYNTYLGAVGVGFDVATAFGPRGMHIRAHTGDPVAITLGLATAPARGELFATGRFVGYDAAGKDVTSTPIVELDGSSTTRGIRFGYPGTANVGRIYAYSATALGIIGNLYWGTHNTHDIGVGGAMPRDISSGRNITCGGRVRIDGTANQGFLEFFAEQSPEPAAPAANGCRLYTKDNGSGKTQLMARFATGAAVQVAIEP